AKDELVFAMPESLLPRRFPIGEVEVIEKAPKERFESFYRRWYTPDRMVLVAVGDVEDSDLMPYIEKYFSDLEARENRAEDPDLGSIKPRGIAARVYREAEASGTSVSI